MKNVVRLFALSLVATGFAASATMNNASAQTKVSTKASICPIPACYPDGTNGCGIWP